LQDPVGCAIEPRRQRMQAPAELPIHAINLAR
jgi:hypothetical protein